MSVTLSEEEAFAVSDEAPPALAMAMRIVTETARLLGAQRLIPIASAHIDGCLYHGDSSVEFVERLVREGGSVMVPSSLNVGSLDLLHPEIVRGDGQYREMARRVMDAYVALGCKPTWTCAPYQAGHRPALGEHVAWGESNAVAFANSVLGARTNRNGDFLDICCAITSRAPCYGLHLDEQRLATMHVDVRELPGALLAEDAFYPVLGAWLGETAGAEVAVFEGIPTSVTEDQLKALGAGAASTGAVGLFHVAGVTPEAATVRTACGEMTPRESIRLSAEMVAGARDRLSTAAGERVDCVVLGSPHFSVEEFRRLEALLAGRSVDIPIRVCTGRGVAEIIDRTGLRARLDALGVSLIVDTCVVVAPILAADGEVMMTSSAKFAHYGPANTGYASVFGSLGDCVESAVAGRVVRDEALWR